MSILEDIKAWQGCDYVHQLTCGNNSKHLLEGKEINGDVILVCPECDYKQKHIPKVIVGFNKNREKFETSIKLKLKLI